MRKVFTSILLCIFLLYINCAFAQSQKLGHVLYRVNCGGVEVESQDPPNSNWVIDNTSNPSGYVDINAVGNKSYGTFDNITLNSSVPSYVPKYIFQIERTLDKSSADSLEYHFSVPYGKKVQVRLYFSEIYFDNSDVRVFDIYVENQLKLKDFDIYNEVGKNVGLMKSYDVTSDGMLNVFLKRVKQLPKINGIEIVELVDNEKFLFRLNPGGIVENAIDGLKNWEGDDVHSPCAYIDTLIVGNKTFIVTDPISVDESVPTAYTPFGIFASERVLGNWNVKDLIYNIPVPNGKTVDVRLFFAELFYDNPGIRVMDVYVEDKLFIDNYDIYAEVGKFRGSMKNFTVLSDGMITIRLSRVAQQPKINGIEILESDQVISSIFNPTAKESLISAFPNPFVNEFTIDLMKVNNYESTSVFDSFGRNINSEIVPTDNGLKISLENQPKGIYYVKVRDKDNNAHSLKVVKF